jgi:hypothetical protein
VLHIVVISKYTDASCLYFGEARHFSCFTDLSGGLDEGPNLFRAPNKSPSARRRRYILYARRVRDFAKYKIESRDGKWNGHQSYVTTWSCWIPNNPFLLGSRATRAFLQIQHITDTAAKAEMTWPHDETGGAGEYLFWLEWCQEILGSAFIAVLINTTLTKGIICVLWEGQWAWNWCKMFSFSCLAHCFTSWEVFLFPMAPLAVIFFDAQGLAFVGEFSIPSHFCNNSLMSHIG